LQNKDDSLTGYQAPDVQKLAKVASVLRVELIKDERGVDKEAMGITTAHAIVRRSPILPGSAGTSGTDFVQEVLDAQQSQHVLVNLLHLGAQTLPPKP